MIFIPQNPVVIFRRRSENPLWPAAQLWRPEPRSGKVDMTWKSPGNHHVKSPWNPIGLISYGSYMGIPGIDPLLNLTRILKFVYSIPISNHFHKSGPHIGGVLVETHILLGWTLQNGWFHIKRINASVHYFHQILKANQIPKNYTQKTSQVTLDISVTICYIGEISMAISGT